MSLDNNWMIQFGAVTQPSPHAPITILGIAGATVQNRYFCIHIHDLLKKRV